MKKIINFLNKYIFNRPGIQYNLFFVLYSAVYSLLLARYVFDNAASLAYNNQNGISKGFGIILLIAIVTETFGVFLKSKEMQYALYISGGKTKTPLKSGGSIILIAIFHLVNNFLIGNLMANAFGISFENYQLLYVLILVIIFIRELFIWYRFFLFLEDKPKNELKPLKSNIVFISNSLLVIYGLIAYTAVWEVFGNLFGNYFSRTDIFYTLEGYFQFFFVLIGVFIMAFIFFLPTRFSFLIDEKCSIKDKTDIKINKITLWIAIFMAVIPYVI
ncbi:MAG: hypothetical protein JXR51_03670 [Bacteroidales bacterium]|nr:hypothetical protein [Bacteroidales bacterium]MBN2756252.1 hypothetical protein [Bacteroidales bacterium]